MRVSRRARSPGDVDDPDAVRRQGRRASARVIPAAEPQMPAMVFPMSQALGRVHEDAARHPSQDRSNREKARWNA